MKRDYSGLLIWSALLVAVVRYAGAFIASDIGQVTGWVSDLLTVMMGITGLGMGVLDVLGAAYVFDGWRKALPKAGDKWSNRFKVLTAFVFALNAAGLVILVPYTVSRVTHHGIADVMAGPMVWAWATAVNIAPYLLIGGVVTGQNGVVSVSHAAVAEAAQERKEERRERKATQVETQETPATLDTRARVLAFYRNDPHGTFTACASQAGVSRQRVAQVVKVLEEEGVISRNGKVKVA